MSHRRKHVQALANEREVSLDDDDVVCRVTAARGSNLVEVVRGDDRAPKAPTPTLVRVPMKFKSVAFFRAGTFVVARFLDDDEVEGSGERCKVTGELTRVLYAEQVKEMRKRGDGTWPEAFEEVGSTRGGCPLRDLVRALDEEEEEETRAAAAAAAAGGEGADGREASDDDSDGDSSLPPLVENRNRRKVQTYVDSDESDSE